MSKPSEQQFTQISEQITFQGDIQGDSDLRIAGTVKGNITTSRSLIVEKTGKIEGEVKADTATVAGFVQGNIECTVSLVLEAKSKFIGNIKTKQLIIENTAFFQGSCVMETEKTK
ncbi:MAG: polymer-forming cytoskeletal protein [Fibrobacter sp.]|jgi:cytoskeletal protein CcmA (bactofilin family)|nr:polymer-forming cytoskeletal protein [Fibrobacter sp.]